MMNEQELSAALHELTPSPPAGLDWAAIDRHAKRHRRRRLTTTAAGAAGAVTALAVGIAVLLSGHGDRQAVVTNSGPTPTPRLGDGRLYVLDTTLLSTQYQPFTACYSILTSLPPAGCGGVPVTGLPSEIPTAHTFENGTVQTSALHLVGHWDGHVLALTQPPVPTSSHTRVSEPSCGPANPTGAALQATITKRSTELAQQGVPVLQTAPCGATVELLTPVASRRALDILRTEFGAVRVTAWLTRADAAQRTEDCAPPTYDMNNISNTLCPDGRAKWQAYRWLQGLSPVLFDLDQSSTLSEVRTALCADQRYGATQPEELQSLQVAAAMYGWAFTKEAVDRNGLIDCR